MLNIDHVLQLVSGIAFLGYGAVCLRSPSMVVEFERYGLARLRLMTGFLEVAGGLGQLAGFGFPTLGLAASAGLGLLMFCGIVTRWRIGDPWKAFLPALTLMLLNGRLLWVGITR